MDQLGEKILKLCGGDWPRNLASIQLTKPSVVFTAYAESGQSLHQQFELEFYEIESCWSEFTSYLSDLAGEHEITFTHVLIEYQPAGYKPRFTYTEHPFNGPIEMYSTIESAMERLPRLITA